jgi:multidrug efflux system membrane fusion protein
MKKFKSVLWSILILLIIVGWIGSGYLTKSEEVIEKSKPIEKINFNVKYIISNTQNFVDTIKVIAKTEALSVIELRSQTNGVIKKIYNNKGDDVNKGDIICEIEKNDKEEILNSAKADYYDAQTKYDSKLKLVEQDFISKNSLISEKTNLEKTRAVLRKAELQIDYLKIVSPLTAKINDIPSQEGELLANGDVCAVLVNHDPIIVSGNVSEKNISKFKVGMPTKVSFIDGSQKSGVVTYISNIAEPATRSFTIEVTVKNNQNIIRVGTTAEIYIEKEMKNIHLIPSSILSLSDEGIIGIKIIKNDNTVDFIPVDISNLNNDGAYISNLPQSIKVITAGQDYVMPGEKVTGTLDTKSDYD